MNRRKPFSLLLLLSKIITHMHTIKGENQFLLIQDSYSILRYRQQQFSLYKMPKSAAQSLVLCLKLNLKR